MQKYPYRVVVYLDEETYRGLIEVAGELNKEVSYLVRHLIRAFIRYHIRCRERAGTTKQPATSGAPLA